jgi:membrane protein DedA with SNARE-associated domain
MLGGLGFPLFPEDGTFILCGVLISSSIVRTFPAILVLYAGVLAADLVIYYFGRKCGERVVNHKRLHRLLPPEKLARLERKFKEKGIYFLILGRHFIGVRAQVIIVSGIMRMPVVKFLIIDTLTVTVTIALWTAIGYGGTHGLQNFGLDLIRRIPFQPL